MAMSLQTKRDVNIVRHEEFLATLGIFINHKDAKTNCSNARPKINPRIIDATNYSKRSLIFDDLVQYWPNREDCIYHLMNHLIPLSVPSLRSMSKTTSTQTTPVILQGASGTGKRGILHDLLQAYNVNNAWLHCDQLLSTIGLQNRPEFSVNQLASILFGNILKQICDKYSKDFTSNEIDEIDDNHLAATAEKIEVGNQDDLEDTTANHNINRRKKNKNNKNNENNRKKNKKTSHQITKTLGNCKDIHSFIYALNEVLPPVLVKDDSVDAFTSASTSTSASFNDVNSSLFLDDESLLYLNKLRERHHKNQVKHENTFHQLDSLAQRQYAPNLVIVFQYAERLYDHDVIGAAQSLLPQLTMLPQLFADYQIKSRRKIYKSQLKPKNHSSSSSYLHCCSWNIRLVFIETERLHINASSLKSGRLLGKVPACIYFPVYQHHQIKHIVIVALKRIRSSPSSSASPPPPPSSSSSSSSSSSFEEDVEVAVVESLVNAGYGVRDIRTLRKAVLVILQALSRQQQVKDVQGGGGYSLSTLVSETVKHMHRSDFGLSHLLPKSNLSLTSSSSSSLSSSSFISASAIFPPQLKILVISCYIAGNSNTENDIKKFTPSEQGRRKRRRNNINNNNNNNTTDNGNSALNFKKTGICEVFGLQRLLALFGFFWNDFGCSSIYGDPSEDKVYHNLTLENITELVNLCLLERIRSNNLNEPLFKSFIPKDLAMFLAAEYRIDLEKYLSSS